MSIVLIQKTQLLFGKRIPASVRGLAPAPGAGKRTYRQIETTNRRLNQAWLAFCQKQHPGSSQQVWGIRSTDMCAFCTGRTSEYPRPAALQRPSNQLSNTYQ